MKDEVDRHWAELLSPRRRNLLAAAAGVLAGPAALAAPAAGQSPWGYETYKQPTPRPSSVRPGEQSLPSKPRAYTDIESYHAHIYFDEDSYQKAALIRKWVAERFKVELGDWNLEPRGPHVTPSFYFGFTNDLLHIIVPWLQLNSLGLTILIHPNTDDPRADHLYYALWVNRAQPVNGYSIKKPGPGEPRVEQIYPNTRPTLPIEKA
ncbi:DOPA 4,5-dioxygenase family protein [Pseudoduganella sp.]|uniref:DOPA 4,5-dioxygenase family protein n=1 Tax=Pseudoduganella sp. TaxID=1880898 RepID=UPI0035AD9576